MTKTEDQSLPALTASIPLHRAPAGMSFTVAINRKRDIEANLERARNARSLTKGRKEQLTREILEMEQALPGMESAAQSSNNKLDLQKVAEFKKSLKHKRLEIGKANARIRELDPLIQQYEADLRACEMAASLQDVLDHQVQVKAASRAADGLRSAIAEEERRIEEVINSAPLPSPLYREREDLLASIALGKGKTSELAALDARIQVEQEASAKAMHDITRRAAEIRQTLIGLNRKLDAELKKLENLRGYTPEILRRFLTAEAERACKEYVNAALVVKERFLQLMALDDLVKQQGGSSWFPGYSSWRLYLPLLGLPQ